MRNDKKRILWLAMVLAVAGVTGWLIFGGKSTGAAEKYKAELRAKGEKISFTDLGFPKPPEDGTGLMRLTNAMNQIRGRSGDAGRFALPHFTDPLPKRVLWQGDGIPMDRSTNLMPWEEFAALVGNVTNELAEIRAAVEPPPRWFQYDPAGYLTNFPRIKYPFVEMRNAAHWLYADGIEALHVGDLARARQNQRALIQLTEFNREDPTLVAAMIRVAIAGLNLQFTWQALQHTNWTEPDLAAMQRDWERVDLLESVENGLTGERAFTELAFTVTRERGLDWIRRSGTLGGPTKPWENVRNAFLEPVMHFWQRRI